MADNTRKEDPVPQPGLGRNQTISEAAEKENTSGSDGEGANPQEGKKWNNYQTRELADHDVNEEKSSEK